MLASFLIVQSRLYKAWKIPQLKQKLSNFFNTQQRSIKITNFFNTQIEVLRDWWYQNLIFSIDIHNNNEPKTYFINKNDINLKNAQKPNQNTQSSSKQQ